MLHLPGHGEWEVDASEEESERQNSKQIPDHDRRTAGVVPGGCAGHSPDRRCGAAKGATESWREQNHAADGQKVEAQQIDLVED